jgi:hypothetical protein
VQLALYKRAQATAKSDSLIENALHHWERRMTDDSNAKSEAMKYLLQAQAKMLMEVTPANPGPLSPSHPFFDFLRRASSGNESTCSSHS